MAMNQVSRATSFQNLTPNSQIGQAPQGPGMKQAAAQANNTPDFRPASSAGSGTPRFLGDTSTARLEAENERGTADTSGNTAPNRGGGTDPVGPPERNDTQGRGYEPGKGSRIDYMA